MEIRSTIARGKGFLLTAVSALALTVTLPSQAFAQASQKQQSAVPIDLPGGPMGPAILALSEALGVNIIATDSLLAGKIAPALSGSLDPQTAIDALLEGSGLTASPNDNGDFIVSIEIAEAAETSATVTEASEASTDPEPLVAETIIVTGQQIDRSLQDTKESVAVITEAEIEARTLIDIQDVFLQAANVTTSGGLFNFNIRGIPSQSFAAGGGSGDLGTVFYDDVAITNSAIAFVSQNLWDVEQVEFLRGPQSTNFGRNALAGAFVIRSKAPSPEKFEAAARLEAGNYDTYAAEGMINMPLTENSALRISAENSYTRGFVDNITTGADDDGSSEFTTVRARYLIEPTSRVTAMASIQYLDGSLGVNGFPVPPGSERDNFQTITAGRDNELYEGVIGSLDVEWDISNDWQIRSITAFSEGDSFAELAPPSIDVSLSEEIDLTQSNISQELKASYTGQRLRGVLGLYYLDDEISGPTVRSGFPFPPTRFGVPPELLPFYPEIFLFSQVAESDVQTENYAFYTQWERDFGENITVSIGGRFDRESFSITNLSFVSLDPSTPLPDPLNAGMQAEMMAPGLGGEVENGVSDANAGIQALLSRTTEDTVSTDFEAFLPEFGITYSVTPDVRLSAFYKRGYRAGGAQVLVTGELNEFDPEYLDNYELSLRSQWLDDRLTINANAYYGSWIDQQLGVPLDGIEFASRTDNVGESTIWGFELETSYAPTDSTSMFASLGYADTQFDEFCSVNLSEPSLPNCNVDGATGKDLSGNQFAFATPWTLSFGGRHAFTQHWYAQANATFQDGSFSDIENLDSNAGEDFFLINLSAGYRSDDFELSFYVRNLLDDFFEVRRGVNGITGFDTITPNAPQQFGIILSKSF